MTTGINNLTGGMAYTTSTNVQPVPEDGGGGGFQTSVKKIINEDTVSDIDVGKSEHPNFDVDTAGVLSEAPGNSKTVDEEMNKAVGALNKKMLINNSEAIFGIHEDTQRVMIKIIDKDSKKVLKEIPPEKKLDMLAKLWKMAGILVDEKG